MPPDEQPAGDAPEAPQGEGTDGGSESYDSLPYDLSEVPPEVREQIEPHLKSIMGNVTQRFQEAADYRRQWEPFEELGLNEYDPGDVQGLLEFAQLSQDPEAFADWWESVGDELGLFEEGDGEMDPDGEIYDEQGNALTAEEVQQIVAEGLAPLQEQMTQQEQQARVNDAYNQIDQQLGELQQEHDLSAEDLDTILKFAYAYEDAEDPISAGFADYQQVIGRGEKSMFDKKSGQPPPVEGAGRADTSPEPITGMAEANKIARERLNQLSS